MRRTKENTGKYFDGKRYDTYIYNAGEELLGDISNGYIYDVVYLDIELPGLNGVEVGQVLREQVKKQHLI